MRARRRLAVLTTLASILAILAGCGEGGPSSPESPQTQPPVVMLVTAAKVRVAPMRQELRLLGTTVAMRHITLRAPASGRVLGLDLQSGDRVRAGEVVAHLVNREAEAAEQGLEVAKQIDPAEAASLARSVSRYAHNPGIAVTAPEDAIVSQRLVSSGQIVTDLEPLADLIDPKSIYVEAAVPVEDILLVRPGMSAKVTSPLDLGIDFPARVVALSPSLTQGAATSPARLQLVGRTISEAGVPVEVHVTTRSVPNAVVIPAAALFQDAANDTFYLFVAGPDGRAHRTQVKTGIRNPNEVQIISGLTPGQLVITSGGYALSDGLKVKVTVAQS
jgi:membrane fusion protein, multidrug efflux system